jgi:hypothetical protein
LVLLVLGRNTPPASRSRRAHRANLATIRRNQEPLVACQPHKCQQVASSLWRRLAWLAASSFVAKQPRIFHPDFSFFCGRSGPTKECTRRPVQGQSQSLARGLPISYSVRQFFKPLKDADTRVSMEQLRRLHDDCKRKVSLNWVSPGSHVLDCGCGRGGDIAKWNSIPKLKITAIDPDEASLTEAQNRAVEAGYGIWFLPPGDICAAAQWGPSRCRLLQLFSALHFENPEIYRSSVEAIGQSVKPGGT